MRKKLAAGIKLAKALKAVFEDGAAIKRKIWGNAESVSMNNGILSILLTDGMNHPWTISDEDAQANDWEIL